MSTMEAVSAETEKDPQRCSREGHRRAEATIAGKEHHVANARDCQAGRVILGHETVDRHKASRLSKRENFQKQNVI